MQGIIIEALDVTKARTRAELKKRALESPNVDAIIEQLHSGLPRIHEEIRPTTPPQGGLIYPLSRWLALFKSSPPNDSMTAVRQTNLSQTLSIAERKICPSGVFNVLRRSAPRHPIWRPPPIMLQNCPDGLSRC